MHPHPLAPADPTADLPRRIGAWAIDLAFFFVFVSIVGSIVGGSVVDVEEVRNLSAAESYCQTWEKANDGFCLPSTDGSTTSALTVEHPWRSVGIFGSHLLLYIALQGLIGASLGKLSLGLAVVDVTGRRIGVGRSAVRTLAWAVDAITCGVPVLGGILIAATKGRRRVGDLVAGTFVVPRERVGEPVLVPGLNAPFAAPGAWYPPPTPPWAGTAADPTQRPPAPGPGASGWGPPATGQTTEWAPPGTSALPPVPPPPAPAHRPEPEPVPVGDGPTWDHERDAYILYDRARGEWRQWDEAIGEWGPITT